MAESLRRERWQTFRDRYGDWSRDLALYLGQRRCGIKLKELGKLAGGIDYGSVSGAIRWLEMRATRKIHANIIAPSPATNQNDYIWTQSQCNRTAEPPENIIQEFSPFRLRFLALKDKIAFVHE